MTRLRRAPRERGAILAMTLIMLLVLLGFAAFAVDLGAQYNLRRQGQSAADAAALGGALETARSGDPQAVLDDVIDRVADVMDRTIVAADWSACTDDGHLGNESGHTATSLGLTPATECLSFSVEFDTVRVRVPRQTQATYFAGVFGVDETSATAVAEAGIVGTASDTSQFVLPFVALAGTTAGTQVCLRDSSAKDPASLMQGNGPGVAPSPGPLPDPCDSDVFPASTSTFGTYNPFEYNGCVQGPGNQSILRSIARGLDHPTGVFGDSAADPVIPPFPVVPVGGDWSGAESLRQSTYGDVRLQGGAGCTVALPNTLSLDTGFNAGGLRCALLSDAGTPVCLGETPRLRRGSFVQSTYRFHGEPMDNTPLWDFFVSDMSAQPTSCQNLVTHKDDTGVLGASWDFYDKHEGLLQCITDWTEGTHPELVDPSIVHSARFAFIPLVAESEISGPGRVHINSYVPVFVDRLYWKKKGTACDPLDGREVEYRTHQAGQAFSCGDWGSGKVDRVSSVVFKCAMLPESLCKSLGFGYSPGGDIGGTQLEVRLSE